MMETMSHDYASAIMILLQIRLFYIKSRTYYYCFQKRSAVKTNNPAGQTNNPAETNNPEKLIFLVKVIILSKLILLKSPKLIILPTETNNPVGSNSTE